MNLDDSYSLINDPWYSCRTWMRWQISRKVQLKAVRITTSTTLHILQVRLCLYFFFVNHHHSLNLVLKLYLIVLKSSYFKKKALKYCTLVLPYCKETDDVTGLQLVAKVCQSAQVDKFNPKAHKVSWSSEENSSKVVGPLWRIWEISCLPCILLDCVADRMIITGKGMLPWCLLFIGLLLNHTPRPLSFCTSLPHSPHFLLPYISLSFSVFLPSSSPLTFYFSSSPTASYILYSCHTSRCALSLPSPSFFFPRDPGWGDVQ